MWHHWFWQRMEQRWYPSGSGLCHPRWTPGRKDQAEGHIKVAGILVVRSRGKGKPVGRSIHPPSSHTVVSWGPTPTSKLAGAPTTQSASDSLPLCVWGLGDIPDLTLQWPQSRSQVCSRGISLFKSEFPWYRWLAVIIKLNLLWLLDVGLYFSFFFSFRISDSPWIWTIQKKEGSRGRNMNKMVRSKETGKYSTCWKVSLQSTGRVKAIYYFLKFLPCIWLEFEKKLSCPGSSFKTCEELNIHLCSCCFSLSV